MDFALKYPVIVTSLPTKGMRVTIEASPQECAQLAQNHSLTEVAMFRADVHLLPWKKRGVKIKGIVEADIVQQCVVSLEPMDSHIDEKIETVYLPQDSKLARNIFSDENQELFLDPDGPDVPETFTGDKLDIGAIVEEFFELAIEPYPRKTQAGLDKTYFGGIKKDEKAEQDEEERPSPFAALKQLKSEK